MAVGRRGGAGERRDANSTRTARGGRREMDGGGGGSRLSCLMRTALAVVESDDGRAGR